MCQWTIKLVVQDIYFIATSAFFFQLHLNLTVFIIKKNQYIQIYRTRNYDNKRIVFLQPSLFTAYVRLLSIQPVPYQPNFISAELQDAFSKLLKTCFHKNTIIQIKNFQIAFVQLSNMTKYICILCKYFDMLLQFMAQ